MDCRFSSKAEARTRVWDRLVAHGVARAPLPPHGRIPAFAGAARAASRLFAEPPWRDARTLKVNPDSAHRYVRLEALRRGIRVYVATPGLTGGFRLLDPARIPAGRHREAAERDGLAEWSVPVALGDLPPLDAIVTGSVAVTADGRRAGKGAGYSDIEFAVLRELGFAAVPVATTVHDLQVVDGFPEDATDQPLTLVCTPTRSIRTGTVLPAPSGIDRGRSLAGGLEELALLRELRSLQAGKTGARS